jgi:transcriptional repressor NrdR
MHCPNCNKEDLRVLEKRDIEGEPAIRRRRECTACGFRFTTYERPEAPTLTVVKKDGRKEIYNREKLARGVKKALEKRPVTSAEVDKLIDQIEKAVYSTGEKEVDSSKIGDLVLEKLKETDSVAYLRFASVYKSFEDVETFKKEAEELEKTRS